MGQLSIICTGRGSHPRRMLGRVRANGGGAGTVKLWTLAPSRDRAGDHNQAGFVTRADGGRTFTGPACPTCGGDQWKVRDDTLTRYWQATRDTPAAGRFDVSYIDLM